MNRVNWGSAATEKIRLGGLGERGKLFQWGPGGAPAANGFGEYQSEIVNQKVDLILLFLYYAVSSKKTKNMLIIFLFSDLV